jgi:hypothetical protein
MRKKGKTRTANDRTHQECDGFTGFTRPATSFPVFFVRASATVLPSFLTIAFD